MAAAIGTGAEAVSQAAREGSRAARLPDAHTHHGCKAPWQTPRYQIQPAAADGFLALLQASHVRHDHVGGARKMMHPAHVTQNKRPLPRLRQQEGGHMLPLAGGDAFAPPRKGPLLERLLQVPAKHTAFPLPSRFPLQKNSDLTQGRKRRRNYRGCLVVGNTACFLRSSLPSKRHQGGESSRRTELSVGLFVWTTTPIFAAAKRPVYATGVSRWLPSPVSRKSEGVRESSTPCHACRPAANGGPRRGMQSSSSTRAKSTMSRWT